MKTVTVIIIKIQIWNSKENSNLPYFYGGANKANTKLFGVAMDSSAPMKISFSSAGKENSNDIVVESTQLGGDFNMVLFLGPSRKDLTTQFVQTFGNIALILNANLIS